MLDADSLVHHFDDRRETVGRARRVGEQPVLRRFVEPVVHAHHDIERITLHGRRHDHFFHATLKIHREIRRRAKFPATLEHDLHPVPRPIHVARPAVPAKGDARRAHPDHFVPADPFGHRLVGPPPLHGIKTEQMRRALRAADGVVDQRHLKLRPAPRCPQRQPPNASKPIDANFRFLHGKIFPASPSRATHPHRHCPGAFPGSPARTQAHDGSIFFKRARSRLNTGILCAHSCKHARFACNSRDGFAANS